MYINQSVLEEKYQQQLYRFRIKYKNRCASHITAPSQNRFKISMKMDA
jgi:hypothetical protein